MIHGGAKILKMFFVYFEFIFIVISFKSETIVGFSIFLLEKWLKVF